jgi:L-asparaginase II
LNHLGLQGGANVKHGGIVRQGLFEARQAGDNGNMQHTPLIELTRGGTLENQHFGSVAVVNTHGQLRAFAGDPHWLTFTRSTLKALQALPFMEAGGPRHFGFAQEHVAMLCASHNGEAKHVQAAQGMLERCAQTYKALRCGCHVPYHFEIAGKSPGPLESFDERYNNCSGKHAGFVAYCVQHGHSLDNYEAFDHPLQQAIRRDVARTVGMDANDLKAGVDGCSAPNYAMPLLKLATGYARLASGAQDSEFGESFAQLSTAMTSRPDIVSGTGRNDLAFMQAGGSDWVAKVGADGVQVVGSKSRGEAFAIKIIDANKPALFAASVEVMEQLGWLDDVQREALRPWRAQPIINARGLLVGERRPAFTLQTP